MASDIDLDNIEFHEQLGAGGFGTVNRVTFKKPFKGYEEAAAKSIHTLREEEIDIMSKLHHPHTVKLLGFYKKGPLNMIIIEYAPNGSLHSYLANLLRPLPMGLKVTWMKQAGLAIQYLHDCNFLHRDIKAQNCLLFEANILKICDFGLAREIHQSQSSSSAKGTICYMAPELHVGNDRGRSVYSKPADIYSYGMLMLEILTRKPPFDNWEWQRVIFKVGMGYQPNIPATCPKGLADIMKRCWSINPKQRPTIDDILAGCPFDTSDTELDLNTPPSTVHTNPLPCDPQEPHKTNGTDVWKLVKTISSQHHNQLKPHTIACCPNKSTVISYWEPGQVFLYGAEGKSSKQLVSPEDQDNHISYVMSMAVSPLGYIIIISLYSAFVNVFDVQGGHVGCFSILAEGEDPNTKVHPKCVAVDQNGHVLVGDWKRKLISIHSCPDGALLKTVQCQEFEDRMTVNFKDQILYSCKSPDSMYDKVVALDYSGQQVFSFLPTIDESITQSSDTDESGRVSIEGIGCDSHNMIYIIMQVCNGYDTVPNTGHLHQYSATGVFVRCIARGIDDPHDLAITNDDELIVTNHDAILVYSAKKSTAN